jgi:hypothetical protein
MELKFNCPACGQHISATPAEIGVTAPCPNCKAVVTVPNPSTSLPPSPRIKRTSQFSVLRIVFILLGILGLFLSFANGWMFGIVVSVIFILLAAIAK